MSRALMCLALIAALSGCDAFKDKGAVIAACRMDAATKLRSSAWDQSDYTYDCMRAQGWVFQQNRKECVSPLQQECYEPHYMLDELLSKKKR